MMTFVMDCESQKNQKMAKTCARCSKTVYFNEEKIAIGKSFHNSCFVCANESCRRRLDSNNLTNHDSEIYCRSCYGKLFGPKGYGFGGGAGVLSMDTADGSIATSNIPAIAQAMVAAKLDNNQNLNHGSTTPSSGGSGASSPSPTNSMSPAPNSNFIAMRSKFGATDICPRCHKAVYMAEKMMGGGFAWHKTTCFNCKECNKRLESTTLCERDNEIYCKTCYGKQWGPKGYGFGLSAGVMQPNEASA